MKWTPLLGLIRVNNSFTLQTYVLGYGMMSKGSIPNISFEQIPIMILGATLECFNMVVDMKIRKFKSIQFVM